MKALEKIKEIKKRELNNYYERTIFWLGLLIVSLIATFLLLVYYKIIKLNFDKNDN